MGQARYLFLKGAFECAKRTPEWRQWVNTTVKANLVTRMLQRMFHEENDAVKFYVIPQVVGQPLPTTAEGFAQELRKPFQQYVRCYFAGKQGMLQGEISHGSRDQIAQMVLFMIEDHFPHCKPLLEGIKTIVEEKRHISQFQVKKSPANFLKYIYLHLANDEGRGEIHAEFYRVKGWEEFVCRVQQEINNSIPRPVNALPMSIAQANRVVPNAVSSSTTTTFDDKPRKVARRRSSASAVEQPVAAPKQAPPENVILKIAALEVATTTDAWKAICAKRQSGSSSTASYLLTKEEKQNILTETHREIMSREVDHNKYVHPALTSSAATFCEWYATPLQQLAMTYFQETRDESVGMTIGFGCCDEQLYHITLLLIRHKWPDCKLLHKGLYQMGKAQPWNVRDTTSKKIKTTNWETNPIKVIEFFRGNYLSETHKTMFDWEFRSVENYSHKCAASTPTSRAQSSFKDEPTLRVIDTVFRSDSFGRARHLMDKVPHGKKTDEYVTVLSQSLEPLLKKVRAELWGDDKLETLRTLVTALHRGFFEIVCGETIHCDGFSADKRFAVIHYLATMQCPILKPAITAMGVHRGYLKESTVRTVRPRLALETNQTFAPVLREILLYATEPERNGFFNLLKGNVLLGSHFCGSRLEELWKGPEQLNGDWKQDVYPGNGSFIKDTENSLSVHGGSDAKSQGNKSPGPVKAENGADKAEDALRHDHGLMKEVLARCKSLPAKQLLSAWLEEHDKGTVSDVITSINNTTIVTPPPSIASHARVTPPQPKRQTLKKDKEKSLADATKPPIASNSTPVQSASPVALSMEHDVNTRKRKADREVERRAEASRMGIEKKRAARELEARMVHLAQNMPTPPSTQ
ncbi:expressed unknown protein [Seminavis robusta]|uniref:Uncharacterized protein n=1 Tax=Seminavis robusta TaxID=568900 RepID=A0A9N8DCB3_9STRA|nr:expressed unknown protein [Seminavis robusta]|eukprot:Sro86_g045870.1 n/a (864) ;mRNA; r:108154-110745